MIDILIVTYKPNLEYIRQQLDSISQQPKSREAFKVYVWDNSQDLGFVARLKGLLAEFEERFLSVQIYASKGNLGFGVGNNRLIEISTSPWVLVLNQEIILEPDCIPILMGYAEKDEKGGAWEIRQIPYEHPKEYDPVTLEAPWVSGAACLFRRQALEQVGGFEPKIFMYGEDVDLSWRIRAGGWKLRYIARAAAIHHTYSQAKEVKPLQIVEGNLTNLCLRARFGTWKDIFKGLAMLCVELLRPAIFPGRRKLLAANFIKYIKRFYYYRWQTGVRVAGFKPEFLLWDFAETRDGAFFEFESYHDKIQLPLVSILVRTCNRSNWLREALLSIKHQTYPNIEVIIVEDGPPVSEDMVIQEFARDMNIKYFATKEFVGRSRAGNIALEKAKGEWLNFLDDDDVFFSDHVEVLVQSVLREKVKGAYALAWETATQVISETPLKYIETDRNVRHNQDFCRITLWHHNYMPIQSVLFHRSLYEKRGGLEEDMEQLEDWNLWTRYSVEDDFILVEKCTSKYRVPKNFAVQVLRQKRLDIAYKAAVTKQRLMAFNSTPRDISELIREYIHSHIVFMIRIEKIHRIIQKFPITRLFFKAADIFLGPLRFWQSPFSSEQGIASTLGAQDIAGHPLVSILIRAANGPQWLKKTLRSIQRQTYPNIEVVIIEYGQSCEKMVREVFEPNMNLRYQSADNNIGSTQAGNIVLEMAKGDWLGFCDDDQILMPEHVETLLAAALNSDVKGVYGKVVETKVGIISEDPLRFKEISERYLYGLPFMRAALWEDNYLGLSSVLFSRKLYEKWGGFDESLQYYADWNLWTRYTLQDNFLLVGKYTSKRIVPMHRGLDETVAKARNSERETALALQKTMFFISNPRDITEFIEAYLYSQVVVMLTKKQIRIWSRRFLLFRVFVRRMIPITKRFLARIGWHYNEWATKK